MRRWLGSAVLGGLLALDGAGGARRPVALHGALAVAPENGHRYGWAANYATPALAERRALRECGEGCRVVLRFADECAVYVVGRQDGRRYGWGTGGTLAVARRRAMAEGRARGGGELVMRVWGCSR